MEKNGIEWKFGIQKNEKCVPRMYILLEFSINKIYCLIEVYQMFDYMYIQKDENDRLTCLENIRH